MPVNEFEKQVQQKMDELKFSPSAEVWTEVEKRIRREKKRRRIIFWWLLPGLLLGGSIAIYFINENKKEKHFTETSQQISTPKENTVETVTADKEMQAPVTSPGAENDFAKQEKQGDKKDVQFNDQLENKTVATKKVIAIAPEPAAASARRNQPVAKGEQKKQQAVVNTQSDPVGKKENEIATVKETTAKQEKEKIIAKDEKVNDQADKTIANEIEKKEEEVTGKTEEKKEPVLADSAVVSNKDDVRPDSANTSMPPVVQSKAKWEFGAGIRAGASGARWGSLLSGGLASFDASPSSQVGSGGTYTGAPVILKPPRNGFSFGVEFFAQRELSKRTELRIAAGYDYFSTHIQTGNRVDSNLQVFNNISNGAFVSNYYRPSFAGMPTREYTNRYHLAGLSATLNWKFIRSARFSMGWENSIGISRLLSANALHYDRNRLAYYNDFEPFRKTQVLVSSGLSFPLLQQKKWTMSFHPSVSFGLTPVLKRQDGPSSHFLNYGAGLKFLFPRNK